MEFVSAFIGLILVYFLQRLLYRCFWNVNLSVNLAFSKDRAVEGETLSLKESITNRKLLPVPMVYLKFKVSRYLKFQDGDQREITDYYNRNELFSLLMYQRITRTLPFQCTKRGVYCIQNGSIVGSGLLLTEEYFDEIKTDASLVVYPRSVDMELFYHRFETLLGTVATQRFIHEDPFTFRGIREYQPTDPMKNINWKASAKTLDWKVNIREFTVEQEVDVYLNLQWESLSSDGSILEESIRLAKTLCSVFQDMGLQVNLYTNGLHYETKEPVQAENTDHADFSDRMNEGLAKIKIKDRAYAKMEDEFEAPNFCELYGKQLENSSREAYRIFISHYQHMDFQKQLERLVKQGKQLTWVIPVSDAKNPEYLLPILESQVLLWSMQWEEVRPL